MSLRGAVKNKKRIEEIISHGKPETAKILKLEDTNVRIGDNPRVKLQLEISIPSYPTYQMHKTLVIPHINLPQVQPDSIINVLADPDDAYHEDRIGIVLK